MSILADDPRLTGLPTPCWFWPTIPCWFYPDDW